MKQHFLRSSSIRRVWSWALCLVMALSLLPSAAFAAGTYADSGSTSMTKLSKDEIAQMVQIQPIASARDIYQSAPSISQPYSAGTLKNEVLQAGLQRLNTLRRIAGLPDVALDSSLSGTYQTAALLNAANNKLSHFPDQPTGMDSSLYQLGQQGTTTSNINFCMSYTDNGPIAYSVDMWMQDDSAHNLDRLGHRRWQLNPNMGKTSWGCVNNGGTYYTAEYSFDESGSGCDYDFIAWPASGNFPTGKLLFNGEVCWSVTLNPAKYAAPSLSSVTVTLRRESDGKTWVFSNSEQYSAAAGTSKYFNVDTDAYGVPNCIIFRPDGIQSYEGVYTVTINGLRANSGGSSLSYQVDFFDPDHYTSGQQTPAAPAAPSAAPSAPSQPSLKILTDPTPTFDVDGAILSDGTLQAWYWVGEMQGKTGREHFTPTAVGTGYKSRTDQVLLKEDGTAIMLDLPYCLFDTFVIGSNVKQVGPQGIVLKKDGTVWSNESPDGGYYPFQEMVQITNNAKQVWSYDGFAESCYYVLKNDGSLWSWTESEDTQCMLGRNQGQNDKSLGKIMDDVAFVSCGAAIKTDGSLWSWGDSHTSGTGKDEFTPVKILENVVSVWTSPEGKQRYAVKADGSLYSWGINTSGNVLGYAGGDKEYSYTSTDPYASYHVAYSYQTTPKKAGIDNAAAVASDGATTIVQKRDGTLWAIGDVRRLPCRTVGNTEDIPELRTEFTKIMENTKLPEGVSAGTAPAASAEPAETSKPAVPAETEKPAAPSTPSASQVFPFSDVGQSRWYRPFVEKAYAAGLVSGTTDTTYSPDKTLTLAETVTLAARIYAESYGETVPSSGSPWYQAAYDYCLSNDIIDSRAFPLSSMKRTATRYEMLIILDNAVPEERMTAVVQTADDSIPDVPGTHPYSHIVYRWYEAGIIAGDTDGNFNGDMDIKRSEVAKILCTLYQLD